jgi:hypothetical protein
LTENKDEKRAYTKPRVKQVRLVAEEAVLATCKTGSAAGFTLCNTYGEACGGFQATS